MAIFILTKEEFDAYDPRPLVRPPLREDSWYADVTGSVLGTLFRNSADRVWGFVIYGPDEAGRFGAIGVATSGMTAAEARCELLDRMQEVAAEQKAKG